MCNRECNARKRVMRKEMVLIADLIKDVYTTVSRTVTPRRAYDTYNTRYTHGPPATTRRRGDARIKRCCRQRPGGVEGTHIREKAPKEGVWAMVAAHGRPRAAGRASAPGRRGLEGARRSRRRRRAERRRTGRRRRGRPTRLEDRRHAPARGGAEDGLVQGPVREPGETSPRRGRSGHGQGL